MRAPDGATFPLAIEAAWLLLLALGALVVRREVAIVERRPLRAGRTVPDGLEVGSPAPRSANPGQDRLLVFLYADCAPCHELVPGLRSVSRPDLVDVVVGNGTGVPGRVRGRRLHLPRVSRHLLSG